MSANANWQCYLYKASEDQGEGTPYNTVSILTVSGYSDYATASFYIQSSFAGWEMEQVSIEDVSGFRKGRNVARRVFTIEAYPFDYNDGSANQDLEDIDSLASFLNGATYLWVGIKGGNNEFPANFDNTDTSTTIFPVEITGWEESLNKRVGQRGLVFRLAHRYLLV